MIFKNFRVDIVGDLDMEDLSADIYFNGRFVAMLSQERGFENLEIELHPPKDTKFWVFNFAEFDEALQYAKNRLWELRKLPENPEDVYKPRFAKDEYALVSTTAPQQYKPGLKAKVCSMRNIDSYELAKEMNETLGEELYLLEFEDGASIGVPDHFLEPLKDD